MHQTYTDNRNSYLFSCVFCLSLRRSTVDQSRSLLGAISSLQMRLLPLFRLSDKYSRALSQMPYILYVHKMCVGVCVGVCVRECARVCDQFLLTSVQTQYISCHQKDNLIYYSIINMERSIKGKHYTLNHTCACTQIYELNIYLYTYICNIYTYIRHKLYISDGV